MDLSKLFFWRNKSTDSQVNIKEAGGTSGGQITQANISNFVVKAAGNINDSDAGDFTDPEYDLSEIHDAVEADSYIKLAVTKYSQLVFKAGYNIVSNNDSAAEYVIGRLNLMSFMTGTPVDVTFQQVADDLVAYSNAFLIKSRIDMTNIGGLTAKGVLSAQPVGGYFRVDPTTMKIKRDKNGTVKNYQQEVGNTTKSYKPEDVVHFYIDKPGGAAFGTPRLSAVLEDVKMLRKLEGSAMKLIYRYAQPLYQMKIGLPEAGLMATDKEIREARSELEKLSDDGVLITNERTEFKVVGADGTALDISPYLKYVEDRVFSALNLSAAMVGRGGAKQDAESMETQVHDTVKFYQKSISTFIVNSMFFEILLEGGFNPVVNQDDIVWFQFNEIDLDTKVKMETHAINKFQGNSISFEEMRQALGMYSDTVDESRLYANMIQQKNAIELAEITAANKATGTGTPGPQAQQKTSGAAKNTISPKNQHGTSSAKIKESFDSDLDIGEAASIATKENIEHYRKKFGAVYKKYSALRNEVCDGGDSDLLLPLSRDEISRLIKGYIYRYATEGMKKAEKDIGSRIPPNKDIPAVLLGNRVDSTLKEMFKDIKKKLSEAKNSQDKESAFNSVEYRLRFLTENIAAKAYWYGYAKTCSYLNIEKIYVDFGNSDDKKEHSSIVNTKHFSLDDIPAFNAYCTCKLSTNKK